MRNIQELSLDKITHPYSWLQITQARHGEVIAGAPHHAGHHYPDGYDHVSGSEELHRPASYMVRNSTISLSSYDVLRFTLYVRSIAAVLFLFCYTSFPCSRCCVHNTQRPACPSLCFEYFYCIYLFTLYASSITDLLGLTDRLRGIIYFFKKYICLYTAWLVCMYCCVRLSLCVTLSIVIALSELNEIVAKRMGCLWAESRRASDASLIL